MKININGVEIEAERPDSTQNIAFHAALILQRLNTLSDDNLSTIKNIIDEFVESREPVNN